MLCFLHQRGAAACRAAEGRRAGSAFTLAATLAATQLAACSAGVRCECVPCGDAVTLSVVDQTGAPIVDDWNVEASLDGQPVDTTACAPEARTSNSCGFGFGAGVYEVVVRTATTEKHVVARLAGRAGQDCCASCLTSDTVPVVLP